MAGPLKLTRTHRILVGLVVTGALIIAGIGFAGSYAAVRALALKKGFGNFSLVFPIGIDAGICVLLALDLLLTWIRIPFPLLRQTAWLLTLATIAFNGAAAWPDPLGVGMHAVIPVLFVVSVEAARHAVGRIADITADKHMEGVRLTRWLLSPLPTFLLWRRMKLWELRSYEETIKLEQERLVYQARLRSRFGRGWRRKAPVESLMPLRLARYGVPLGETAPAGLAAAGIEPALLPPAPAPEPKRVQAPELPPNAAGPRFLNRAPNEGDPALDGHPGPDYPEQWEQQAQQSPWFQAQPNAATYEGGYDPQYVPEEQYEDWYAGQEPEDDGYGGYEGYDGYQEGAFQPPAQVQPPMPGVPGVPGAPGVPEAGAGEPGFRVPAGPGRTRRPGAGPGVPIPSPRAEQRPMPVPEGVEVPMGPEPGQEPPLPQAAEGGAGPVASLPDDLSREEAYFQAFRKYVNEHMDFPNARQFGLYLQDLYGVMGQSGGPLTESTLRPYLRDFRDRYQQELDAEHIA